MRRETFWDNVFKFKNNFTSVKECKEVSPNFPKGIFYLGVGILWVFQFFVIKVWISNLVQMEPFLLNENISKFWKEFEFSIWRFEIQIMMKKWLKFKLTIRILTIKIQKKLTNNLWIEHVIWCWKAPLKGYDYIYISSIGTSMQELWTQKFTSFIIWQNQGFKKQIILESHFLVIFV
jgi:hypothetical protein